MSAVRSRPVRCPTLLPGGRPLADAGARAEVASAWGVESLADTAGRDTAGIVAAAASGELDALVVGGVDPADLGVAGAAEAFARPFVVSLEIRPSAVTAVADVVLPVAAHAEKAGTFVDWEGRVRSFEAALDTAQVSDYRALDMLADEMGEFLGTRTVREVRAEMEALGPWQGARAARPGRRARRRAERRGGHPGARHLAPPARPRVAAGRRAVPRRHRPGPGRPGVGATTASGLGVVDGDALTVRVGDTTVTAPVLVSEMADHVVWLPTNSVGSDLRAALAGAPGALVSVTKEDQRMSALLALPQAVSTATGNTDNPDRRLQRHPAVAEPGQGADHLRLPARSRPCSSSGSSAASSAACSSAPAPTATARSACCRPWPTA